MQALIDAGIIDLGGNGSVILEIEFINGNDEYKEAFYRLPQEVLGVKITGREITQAFVRHSPSNCSFPSNCSLIVLRFGTGNDRSNLCHISLRDVSKNLIAVRLDKQDVTHRFQGAGRSNEENHEV